MGEVTADAATDAQDDGRSWVGILPAGLAEPDTGDRAELVINTPHDPIPEGSTITLEHGGEVRAYRVAAAAELDVSSDPWRYELAEVELTYLNDASCEQIVIGCDAEYGPDSYAVCATSACATSSTTWSAWPKPRRRWTCLRWSPPPWRTACGAR